MKVSNKFSVLLLGGLIIQSAVAVKNSMEKLKIEKPQFAWAAKSAFIAGWIIVAYSIGMKKTGFGLDFKMRTLIAFIGAGMIVVAVFHMKDAKKNNQQPIKALQLMFPIGWVLTCVAIIMNKSINACLAILGTGFVLASMMVIIPKQRELNLVDGPGYNLFANAWWLLAMANGIF